MFLNLELFIKWFQKSSEHLMENKQYLTDLDSPIGDADHGANISRGFEIITKQFEQKKPETIEQLFKDVAMVMMTKVGGASGMLYAAFFLKASAKSKDMVELDVEKFTEIIEAGVNGIISRGRAELNDKTMIDVWVPFLNSLKESENKDIKEVIGRLVDEAKVNIEKTKDLIAKKGRASYLGERSVGNQDPGATSTYFILLSLKEVLEEVS